VLRAVCSRPPELTGSHMQRDTPSNLAARPKALLARGSRVLLRNRAVSFDHLVCARARMTRRSASRRWRRRSAARWRRRRSADDRDARLVVRLLPQVQSIIHTSPFSLSTCVFWGMDVVVPCPITSFIVYADMVLRCSLTPDKPTRAILLWVSTIVLPCLGTSSWTHANVVIRSSFPPYSTLRAACAHS